MLYLPGSAVNIALKLYQLKIVPRACITFKVINNRRLQSLHIPQARVVINATLNSQLR